MQKKSIAQDLTVGRVAPQLLRFSVPFMLSNLLQTVYNLVDMVIVGQFVGSAGLSAVSIGGEALNLVTVIGMGFTSAGQILISQYVGRNDSASIRKTIGTMFTGILGASFLVAALFCAFSESLLNALNTPAEAFSQAYQYSMICFSGTFFIFGYNIVSSILRGMGDGTRPLIFVAIAAGVHLVLALLLVGCFDMGAAGAALATVIGQAVSFIISVVYLYHKREIFGFDFKPRSFIPDREVGLLLLRLGVPMCLHYCAINISQMFVNSFINAYGVVASAVTGIGSKLTQLASVVTTSLFTAGSAMAGQSFGANKPERVSRMMGVVAITGCGFAAILSAAVILAPEAVFRLFNQDPEVLAMAHSYIPVAVLLFFGFAARAPFVALINGQGFASLSLVMGIADGVFARVGLSMLLGIVCNLGIMGFWFGNAIAGYCVTLIGGIYYFSGIWKKRRLLIGEKPEKM